MCHRIDGMWARDDRLPGSEFSRQRLGSRKLERIGGFEYRSEVGPVRD